jgi:hypothetical protein
VVSPRDAGHSFGSRLDQDIQSADYFKNLPSWLRWIIKHLLDFLHHWWIGAILWVYAVGIAAYFGYPWFTTEILFFGLGLMIDDIRDIENLKRRLAEINKKPEDLDNGSN